MIPTSPRIRAAVLALAAGTSLGSCSHAQRAGAETAAARALISDEDENKLGAQFHGELEKKGVRYFGDAEVVGYVQGVADRILAHAKNDRPAVAWRVHVVDDPKTVNAFATPGGYLYVYTGLIKAADSEAELAAVWGHEAAHVVRRHSARQMVTMFGLQTVAAMALGQNPGKIAEIAAGVAANGYMLKNSRDDEREADELGTRYASRAGYDPHGIATFFQKLAAKQGKVPEALTWLSTHPESSERVQTVNNQVAREGLGGNDVGADRLAAIKTRLGGGLGGSSPPPPPAPAAAPPAAPPSRPAAPPPRPR